MQGVVGADDTETTFNSEEYDPLKNPNIVSQLVQRTIENTSKLNQAKKKPVGVIFRMQEQDHRTLKENAFELGISSQQILQESWNLWNIVQPLRHLAARRGSTITALVSDWVRSQIK